MAVLSYFLLFLLHSFRTVVAEADHKCEGGNYTANSTYQSNLQLLLSSLSSANSTYTADSKGDPLHRAYGLVLCRGDVDSYSCPTCYQDLSRNVTRLCGYSKQAIFWVPDCMLRYSDTNFFSSVDTPQVVLQYYNGNTPPDPDTFSNATRALFQKVMFQAAHNSSLLFGTGQFLMHNESEIYALVQCTRDLTGDMCGQCLQQELDYYWRCCRTNMGGRYFGKSCFSQFEVNHFYRGDPDITLTSPPTPPNSAPTGESPAPKEGTSLPSLFDVDEEMLRVKIIHENLLPMRARDNNHIMKCILKCRRECLCLHEVLANFKDFERASRIRIKECEKSTRKCQRDLLELYKENLDFFHPCLVLVHQSLEFVDRKVKEYEKIMSDRDQPNSGYDLEDDD